MAAFAGLAPGKHGANCTGRPFTGDYAGDLLFTTLAEFGLSSGYYDARIDDGLALVGAIIVNSVKCLPPQNKPEPAEIRTCNRFLADELAASPEARLILALGLVAHKAVLMALGLKQGACAFGHGARHALLDGRILIDSYHCSRYNTQTRRLTAADFHHVFAAIRAEL